MTLRDTIARNTAYNAFGRLWDAVVAIVLASYVFGQLGRADYGLWAVVSAFTGYAALFDVGVGSAYAKYIAEHAARDEHDDISRVVTTGFLFYLVFGALFVGVTWLGLDVILALVARLDPAWAGDWSSETVRGELRALIRWGLVLFAVSNCVAPFTAIQTGLQRMGATNGISVAASIVKVVLTIAFLESGYGVRGLMYANAGVLVVFGVLTVAVAFVLHPALRVTLRFASADTFRRLYQFGWRAQVSRLANLIMFETDVLVIAIVLRNLELAGLYRIGVELANKMRQFPAILLSALLPAAATLDAVGDSARLKRLYVSSSKYVAFVAFPLAVFLAGSAPFVMKAWIGGDEDLTVAVIVLQIMAIGYIANIVPGAGVSVALGMGRPGLQMGAGLVSMTANIVLTLTLVFTVGFYGIPIATALSMAISWAWFARAMRGLVDIPPRTLLRQTMLWPALAVLPGLALCVASQFLLTETAGRMASLPAVVVLGMVFVAFYLFVLRFTPFFDRGDLDFFDESLGLRRVPGYLFLTNRIRKNVVSDHA